MIYHLLLASNKIVEIVELGQTQVKLFDQFLVDQSCWLRQLLIKFVPSLTGSDDKALRVFWSKWWLLAYSCVIDLIRFVDIILWRQSCLLLWSKTSWSFLSIVHGAFDEWDGNLVALSTWWREFIVDYYPVERSADSLEP